LSESMLLGLASIIALGIAAQWFSWRLRLPAILLLLIFGLLAGPVFGIVRPDELFGELLFPLVSVSVAIILFEGGLSLNIDELKRVGHIVRNLTTIGILVTWILAGLGAYYIIGFGFWPSALVGAILVVTGPTVIIPLLRQVRPTGNVGSIVKWEGIVNDPFGAILAVLVFELLVSSGTQGGTSHVLISAAQAMFLGSLIGLAGAGLMVLFLRYYLIPDFLQSPVSLMVVVLTHTAANAVQPESGLLAVTLMGIALANQKFVSIKHITEFKENLRVILISSLFIILASRLTMEQLTSFKGSHWIFVVLLIIIVRPLAVYFSTIKPSLKINERAFLAWMAPRGIVAAAVSSVFAVRVGELGYQNSDQIVPLVFQVILGTVAIYGLTALPIARLLKVSQADPQGILFIGAQSWAREIARALKEEGFRVALVDSNWSHVAESRKSGCRAYYGNALAEEILHELQLDGIGRLFAVTSNDEVNSLAALHFADLFDRNNLFQLSPERQSSGKKSGRIAPHLRGRLLFGEDITFEDMKSRFENGAMIKKTYITKEFDYDDFVSMHGDSFLPLIVITESRDLKIFTTETQPSPQPGQILISMISPSDNKQISENNI
jgi:NhaP-type Na+/H+ or K+/H+ antiporter